MMRLTRSIERATNAVVFFDKHIDRSIAEVRYVAIYNKLFSNIADHPGSNFDQLFADVKTEEIDARIEAKIERLHEAVKSGRFPETVLEPGFELVEAFPANFYENGIRGRNVIKDAAGCGHATLAGNADFALTDVIKTIAGHLHY